jgi:hypothetical protein
MRCAQLLSELLLLWAADNGLTSPAGDSIYLSTKNLAEQFQSWINASDYEAVDPVDKDTVGYALKELHDEQINIGACCSSLHTPPLALTSHIVCTSHVVSHIPHKVQGTGLRGALVEAKASNGQLFEHRRWVVAASLGSAAKSSSATSWLEDRTALIHLLVMQGKRQRRCRRPGEGI